MPARSGRLGVPARRRASAALIAALAATAAMTMATAALEPVNVIEIDIRFSHFVPAAIEVPLGVPVTFRIHNADPIDHEWIVGDARVQTFHRISDSPLHAAGPTEVVVPALSTRVTTVTFDAVGQLAYICHLPGHEAYGMTGWVTIRP